MLKPTATTILLLLLTLPLQLGHAAGQIQDTVVPDAVSPDTAPDPGPVNTATRVVPGGTATALPVNVPQWRGAPPAVAVNEPVPWFETAAPDQTDWSNKRRSGYAKSLQVDVGIPSAVLRIPTLDIAVPVFDNAGRLALERGLGWVDGTAFPGEAGNVAIAGHRDGFFRPLEGIEPGAIIELTLPEQAQRYRVVRISIVDPLDVSVLEDNGLDELTLITCYPFRYRGFAPDRYIVHAVREPAGPGGAAESAGAPVSL